MIAPTQQLLTALFDKGQVSDHEKNGDLVNNLYQITRTNDGAVIRIC